MSAPTGDPALIRQLNEMLGQQLGRNVYNEPIFSWRWSEDCFWMARQTGRTITEVHEVHIPILGTGQVERAIEERVVPEYTRDRQVRRQNTWYICKWLSPAELILGGSGAHGEGYKPGTEPTHEALVLAWGRINPGVDFPAKGWRIPTDAYLPRSPQDPTVPNLEDTRYFIHRVKEQTSMSFDLRLADMIAAQEANEAAVTKRMEDEIRDSFPAFLNPVPGKKSNFVSMPWTWFDRNR